MVNEINKPPSSENLNERLAASNRQLREMQEEHRQLLQEMESLRERANELNRLSLQRQQLQRQQREHLQELHRPEEATTISVSNELPTTEQTNPTPPPQEQSSQVPIEEEKTVDGINDNAPKPNDQDDDDASVEYIKAKVAEIAALKAQYKRVQEMVQTTNLIEQHLSSESVLDETKNLPVTTTTRTTEISNSVKTTTPLATTSSNVSNESSASTTTDPKAELLNSMLGMFTNISDDLRGQAESLRAERERIRDLKELLLQRRKGDTKPTNTDQ